MDDTKTLNPFSTKPRENIKVGPQNQIGGPMGILDEWGGELIRTPQQMASDGGSFVKEGLSFIGDLIKEDIAGQESPATMPATGSIENFQQGVAKSPELLQKEKEAQHNRVVYSSMEEARINTQKFAHERALEDMVRFEVNLMPSDKKKEKLHLSRDLRDEHINNPHHLTNIRIEAMEELKAAVEASDQQTANEIAPKGPDFNRNKANELGPTSIYNAAG